MDCLRTNSVLASDIGKQSVSTRLAIKNLVSYTKSNLSIGVFSVEGKNNIVVPIFKTKNSLINKEEFIPRPAAKLQVENLTIFKRANPSLAADIAKRSYSLCPLNGMYRSTFTYCRTK